MQIISSISSIVFACSAEMSKIIQIPPVGMKFRLIGIHLQNILVGRGTKLARGEVKKDFNYNDDTWFTLQESDSDEYYRIEHCTTGSLLARGKKKAFLIKPDDQPLDDQKLLWKVEFGDENTFQIINF